MLVQWGPLTESVRDQVFQLEVRPCDRRPMGIKRKHREIVAEDQSQDNFRNDAATDGPELRGADRPGRACNWYSYSRFIPRGLGEHVCPEGAVFSKCAVSDRVDR